jgi:preprotein translocase subunit SecE
MRLRWAWIVGALGVVLLVAVAFGIFSFGLDWKAWIGWRALIDHINAKNAKGRKDAVQVYALIVAGVVAAITAAVGLVNLWLSRRNLEQQRELEDQRAEQQRQLAQGTALQPYYEQIGKLLTDKELRTTEREEIRELARGQTLTVLQEVDGNGKESLLTFLYAAGLLKRGNPAVVLSRANL